MPAVVGAGLARSPACDGKTALPDVRPPGRWEGAAGTVVGVEGRRAAGAAPGGGGAAPPASEAGAGLGRLGDARCPAPAAHAAAADVPAGDAGDAAALAPSPGPLALDLPPPQRQAAR